MDPIPDAQPCPNCGALLDGQDRFCWQCGAGRAQSFPASRPTAPRGLADQVTRPLVVTAGVVLGVIFALLAGASACESGEPVPTLLAAAAAIGCCLAAGYAMARPG